MTPELRSRLKVAAHGGPPGPWMTVFEISYARWATLGSLIWSEVW